jgi:ABC-type Mn2+/Zn2+ transport system ATPase subunit
MSVDELKLASLILSNFSDVESKSSAGGARANKLSVLIIKDGKSVIPYVVSEVETALNKPKIKTLKKLSVKGFRGFNEKEEFDLSKKFTFIYGLNGTGKSSFCEALEYSLTGKINEASSKRFDSDQYVNNKSSLNSEVSLIVEYDDGNLVPAIQAPLDNEFIFVERNRIEAFARVSSFAPQGQQQRLSALFGLEEFNSFCRGFNKTIENKLPIVPYKEKELKVKEREVEKSKLIIENKKYEIKEYEKRKNLLLSKYPHKKLISEVLSLLGDNDLGLIAKKKDEIEKLSQILLRPIDKIEAVLNSLMVFPELISAFSNLSDEVKKYKNEINFVDLYSAINSMSSNHIDCCPACDTPMLHVTTNPFDKANRQLKLLEVISAKQKYLQENERTLSNSLIKLSSELKIFGIVCTLTHYNFVSSYELIKSELEKKIVECNKWNDENREVFTKVLSYKEELKAIESHYRECSTISELYKVAYKEKSRAEKVISEFNSSNKDLIDGVEEEKQEISYYLKYSAAYESFVEKLKYYSETLPVKLSKSLENQVVGLYNAINKHPFDHEVLKSINLPTKPNDGIKIEYLDGTKEDALRVLSEGHLRCLGLSILLAKNIHDNHSVIIFDDVVNAIDDEHRAGIINELFSNILLSEKQMILTTHGEDFIKRLENQLISKGLNKKLARYDFVRNRESREVLIEPNINRHYLVKAKNNFEKGLIKDGLMECRRSLEELAPRLWRKMKSEGLDPALTVKLRAPSAAPDLYNLIDGLIGYIEEIEKKPGIRNFSIHRQCLMQMKDFSKKNQITWILLNKGTHEEDRVEEFDENQAEKLFKLCVQFESLIKNYSREEFRVDVVSLI